MSHLLENPGRIILFLPYTSNLYHFLQSYLCHRVIGATLQPLSTNRTVGDLMGNLITFNSTCIVVIRAGGRSSYSKSSSYTGSVVSLTTCKFGALCQKNCGGQLDCQAQCLPPSCVSTSSTFPARDRASRRGQEGPRDGRLQ